MRSPDVDTLSKGDLGVLRSSIQRDQPEPKWVVPTPICDLRPRDTGGQCRSRPVQAVDHLRHARLSCASKSSRAPSPPRGAGFSRHFELAHAKATSKRDVVAARDWSLRRQLKRELGEPFPTFDAPDRVALAEELREMSRRRFSHVGERHHLEVIAGIRWPPVVLRRASVGHRCGSIALSRFGPDREELHRVSEPARPCSD